jgi:hypothetical protein
VSLTVVSRETALRNLARIRSEDKDLFARTRRAIAMRTRINQCLSAPLLAIRFC